MSEPSRSSRMELEPVTCWPLILGAVSFVGLGILGVAGFAAWSALFPPPKPDVAVAPAPEREAPPANLNHIHLPQQQVVRNDEERVVKVRREVVRLYTPLPRPSSTVAERSPALPPLPSRKVARPAKGNVIPTMPKTPRYSEKDLVARLWEEVPLLDLETEKGAGKKLLEAGKKLTSVSTTPIRDLLKARADLRGLPLQDEKDCPSSKEAAKVMAELSLRVRRLQARADVTAARMTARRGSPRPPEDSAALAEEEKAFLTSLAYQRDKDLLEFLSSATIRGKETSHHVRPLMQMLQCDTPGIRAGLVSTLASIKGKEATTALARRAVFDLDAEARHEATKALKKRSLDDARPILLSAFRHPWAPAADHAAEALTALNDQKAIPALEQLVDQPDPRQPHKEGTKWVVRELVRVNHLRNCLLCHPPLQTARSEVVIGPIPTPGEPLPVIYYSGRRSTGEAVRADVVYFRQDFSVMHRVEKPDKWPAVQRFDYLVRKRELTSGEVEKMVANGSNVSGPKTYPQREAVRYALNLLGKEE